MSCRDHLQRRPRGARRAAPRSGARWPSSSPTAPSATSPTWSGRRGAPAWGRRSSAPRAGSTAGRPRPGRRRARSSTGSRAGWSPPGWCSPPETWTTRDRARRHRHRRHPGDHDDHPRADRRRPGRAAAAARGAAPAGAADRRRRAGQGARPRRAGGRRGLTAGKITIGGTAHQIGRRGYGLARAPARAPGECRDGGRAGRTKENAVQILGLIVVGLIIGALARLIKPGQAAPERPHDAGAGRRRRASSAA